MSLPEVMSKVGTHGWVSILGSWIMIWGCGSDIPSGVIMKRSWGCDPFWDVLKRRHAATPRTLQRWHDLDGESVPLSAHCMHCMHGPCIPLVCLRGRQWCICITCRYRVTVVVTSRASWCTGLQHILWVSTSDHLMIWSSYTHAVLTTHTQHGVST